MLYTRVKKLPETLQLDLWWEHFQMHWLSVTSLCSLSFSLHSQPQLFDSIRDTSLNEVRNKYLRLIILRGGFGWEGALTVTLVWTLSQVKVHCEHYAKRGLTGKCPRWENGLPVTRKRVCTCAHTDHKKKKKSMNSAGCGSSSQSAKTTAGQMATG